MNTVFVDTGYLLALELAGDQHHSAARGHWSRVSAELPTLATTSFVFDEVVTFFNPASIAADDTPRRWQLAS